jgi:NADPH:quinone reductase-like Zn-dependent oxidoreductase
MEHAGLGLDAVGTIEAVGPGVLLEVGTAVIAFDAAVLRPTKARPNSSWWTSIPWLPPRRVWT